MSSSTSTTNQTSGNQSVLNDITYLQNLERDLYNILETNTSLTSEQRTKILTNINDISNMRVNLYATLGNMNDAAQAALDTSLYSFSQQVNAISIMENELTKSRERVELMEDEKNNKLRLVEINNYYAEKYYEHSKLLKIVIYTLAPIIVVNYIYAYGLLPYSIFIAIIVLITAIGSYYFWNIFSSMVMRDNMNYNKYDWKIDPPAEPEASNNTSNDPWLTGSIPGTCLGSDCCDTGMTYNYTLDKCVAATSNTNNTNSTSNTNTNTNANTNNSSSTSAAA